MLTTIAMVVRCLLKNATVVVINHGEPILGTTVFNLGHYKQLQKMLIPPEIE